MISDLTRARDLIKIRDEIDGMNALTLGLDPPAKTDSGWGSAIPSVPEPKAYDTESLNKEINGLMARFEANVTAWSSSTPGFWPLEPKGGVYLKVKRTPADKDDPGEDTLLTVETRAVLGGILKELPELAKRVESVDRERELAQEQRKRGRAEELEPVVPAARAPSPKRAKDDARPAKRRISRKRLDEEGTAKLDLAIDELRERLEGATKTLEDVKEKTEGLEAEPTESHSAQKNPPISAEDSKVKDQLMVDLAEWVKHVDRVEQADKSNHELIQTLLEQRAKRQEIVSQVSPARYPVRTVQH